MPVLNPIFQEQLVENKIRPLIVWVQGRVEKCQKIISKTVSDNYQDVTHVSTSIFQGLFKM